MWIGIKVVWWALIFPRTFPTSEWSELVRLVDAKRGSRSRTESLGVRLRRAFSSRWSTCDGRGLPLRSDLMSEIDAVPSGRSKGRGSRRS